jgi:hypothetical protein
VVAIAVALSRNNGSSTGSLTNQQLASMRLVCQQWTGGSAPSLGNGPASASCVAMTNWMAQQLRGGHMTSMMMWGSATTMRDTCRQWRSQGGSGVTSSANAQVWCDGMVAAMQQRIGDWNGWMMSGHMMGR